MVNELRINALEPAGVALLDQLGIITVKRATLATGKRAVQNVSDDPARESQPVTTGFPFLFEDPLADEPVDFVVEVLCVFRQRIEVLGVERLPQHGGAGATLPKLLGGPLDPTFDGLLAGHWTGT